MDYKSTELQNVCDVTSSKRIYARELCSTGVPFYRSKEIIEKLQGIKEHTNTLYISEERYQKIIQKTGSLSEGDLLLTSRGTLGVPYIVNADDRFHFADGNLTWFLNFNGLHSKYLKYFFLSPAGKSELSRCVIGSSQSAYTIASLKKIFIPLPRLDYQLKVVEVLFRYDNLIENNNRRIAILEDMAQSLYREWFVHFRFPGHENCQFKDSELGRIPEGWEAGTIGDLFIVKSGYAFKSKQMGNEISDYAVVKIKNINEAGLDIDNIQYISKEYVGDKVLKFKLQQSDVLIAMTGAQVGKVSFVPKTEKALLLNQRVGLFSFEKKWLGFSFLWQVVNSDYFQKEVNNRAQGAAQPNISASDIQGIATIIPPQMTIQAFEKMCDPMFEEVRLLQNINSILKNQRDMLLPKLISGKIEV